MDDLDLEYIGPPDYATSLVDIQEWPESLQEPRNTNWTGLSFPIPETTSDLSELPRLPAPPAPSPTPPPIVDEPATPSGYFGEDDVAPQDINIEFDDRNIVSGKRRRTVSSHATDSTVVRPAKKGPRSRETIGIQLGYSSAFGSWKIRHQMSGIKSGGSCRRAF
ncbi:hypothetical protein B0H13DRAFT_1856298 [Mycena leptocephala]|nr:hypothetical protein B0H13DRAFT_1856298 [Mycena leptocephala]